MANVGTLNVTSLETVLNLRASLANITTLNVGSLFSSGNNLTNVQIGGSLANLFVSNSVTTKNVFASGQVGIGTTNPESSLHVTGSSPVSTITIETGTNAIGQRSEIRFGIPAFRGTATRAAVTSTTYVADGSDIQFWTNASYETASAPQMTILPGGNVGIGTTTPGAALDVVASPAEEIGGSLIAQFGTNTPRIQLYDKNNGVPPYIHGNAGWGLGLSSIGPIRFFHGETPAIFDNYAGCIGESDDPAPFYLGNPEGPFHNRIKTRDSSIGAQALAVSDYNGEPSLAPRTMVNFTRQENDGIGAFHLEFVNSEYGVGLGFLDGAATPSPFIMSIHNPYNDGVFQLSNTAGDVAVSMAMDGTNFVGVNTAAPTSQLSVQSSPIFNLNLIHNFGGNVLKSLISDDGNTVAILDDNHTLKLWTKTGGTWVYTVVATGNVDFFDMTRDGQNVVYLTTTTVIYIYPSNQYVNDGYADVNSIAFGGSSNIFLSTSTDGSIIFSFDGTNWNGYNLSPGIPFSISASDDGVYAVVSNAYGTYHFSNVSGTWTSTQVSDRNSRSSMSSDGQVICEYTNGNIINIYRNKILEFTFNGNQFGNADYSPFLSKDGNTFSYIFAGGTYLYKYRNGQWVPCRSQFNASTTVSLNYDASKLMGYEILYSVSYSTKAFNVDDSLVVSNGDITTPAFYSATGSLWDQGTQKESADSTAVSSDGSLVAYGSLANQTVKVYKSGSLVKTISQVNPYALAINSNILAIGTGSGSYLYGDYRNFLTSITLENTNAILVPSLSADASTTALGTLSGSNVYVAHNRDFIIKNIQSVPASRGTAVSSDGHWVAFGNHVSGQVRVYKDGVQFGSTITDPVGGQTFFGAFVSLNSDGSVLAVAGDFGAQIFTRTQTGWFYSRDIDTTFNTLVKPCLSGNGRHVILGAFYSGSEIGGGDQDTTVRAFNTQTGVLDWAKSTVSGSHTLIRTVFSGDGNTAVIFYRDQNNPTNIIEVYGGYSDPQLVSQTSYPSQGVILSLSVTYDGQTICASDTVVIKIFDRQLNVIQTITPPQTLLSSAMSGDGQTLIVGQQPLGSITPPYPVLVYKKQNGSFVQGLSINPSVTTGEGYFGEEVAIDYYGGVVSITEDIQTVGQDNLGDPTGYSSLIVSFAPRTSNLYFADYSKSQLLIPASRSTSVSSDGHWVAFGNHTSQTVRIYRDGVQFGSTITSSDTYFGAFVSLNSDGSVLAVGGPFGKVYTYARSQTGWNQTSIITTGFLTIYRPSLSGDGLRVIFGAWASFSQQENDSNFYVYTISTREHTVTDVSGGSPYIRSVTTAFSEDGSTFAVLVYDLGPLYLRVYRNNTLISSSTLSDGTSSPFSLSITRDGSVVCASGENHVYITGQTIDSTTILSSAMSGDGQTLIVAILNNNDGARLYKKIAGQFVFDSFIPSTNQDVYFGEETAIDYSGKVISITADVDSFLGDPGAYNSLIVFLDPPKGHRAVVTGDGSKVIVTNLAQNCANVYDPTLTYWSNVSVLFPTTASTNFDGTIININSEVFTQIPNFNQLIPIPPLLNLDTRQYGNSFAIVSQLPVTSWTLTGISNDEFDTDGPNKVIYFFNPGRQFPPTVVNVSADTNGSVNFMISAHN